MDGYNFGRTLARTFALVRDGLPTVGVFMAISTIATSAINFVLQGQLAGQVRDNLAAGSPSPGPVAMLASPLYWLTVAIALVLSVVVYTGSIHGYLAVERQAPVSIGECFAAGLRRFLPALGLLILWFLGVGFGWILLMVPGLMLMTAWSTALVALIAGDSGVFGSFGRSRALTKGYRWAIFGTLLVALLILYAPLLVFGGALISMSRGMLEGQTPSALVLIGGAVYGWAAGMLLNALLTSIYLDCRLAKEGATSGQLSDVFE